MTSVVAGDSEILRRLPGEQALLAQDFKFRVAWWSTWVDQRTGFWLRDLPDDPGGRAYLRISRGRMLAVADGTPGWQYRALLPGGPCYVKYLGPAFFTKFLYIADSSCHTHPRGALIMDRFVVKTLTALHGWDEPTYGWGSHRYPHWLEIASEQAALAADELGRPVRRDEIELTYFRYSKTL